MAIFGLRGASTGPWTVKKLLMMKSRPRGKGPGIQGPTLRKKHDVGGLRLRTQYVSFPSSRPGGLAGWRVHGKAARSPSRLASWLRRETGSQAFRQLAVHSTPSLPVASFWWASWALQESPGCQGWPLRKKHKALKTSEVAVGISQETEDCLDVDIDDRETIMSTFFSTQAMPLERGPQAPFP